ncbi:replication protein RepA [Nocardia suismassiliense]|uniref:replication protein RepA n=1 Tax=Nocardia suismassiliense TaxID=2077092 RepID=UPI00131F24DB|nr:replication protein RepA [Nocardia suismassiliense]
MSEDDRSYVPRMLTQASLPFRDGVTTDTWQSSIGTTPLILKSGMTVGEYGRAVPVGYPFGVFPRLLLVRLGTDAIRTGSRELVLPESCSEFVQRLGLRATGGSTGGVTRVRHQLIRLLSSSITFTAENTDRAATFDVTDSFTLWPLDRGEVSSDAQPAQSTIRLSPEFFEQITTAPTPVNWQTIDRLRRAPLHLDIYFWLAARARTVDTTSTKQLVERFDNRSIATPQSRRSHSTAMQRALDHLIAVDVLRRAGDGRVALHPNAI